MPGAAIVAAALTDHSSRVWQLLVDGLDVSGEPGSKRYWVPIDSVEVSLAGPGGVSAMSFVIRDPQSQLSITGGEPVLLTRIPTAFPDNISDRKFLGTVARVKMDPMRGQVGRQWTLDCDGIEKVLDDTVTTVALSFTTATFLYDMIQAIVGVATGLGELRAFADTGTALGTDAKPIGNCQVVANQDAATLAVIPVTIPAGTTVREAINMAFSACANDLAMTYNDAVMITVDVGLGLRAWLRSTPSPSGPAGTSSIPFIGPPDTIPEGLSFDIDAASVIRGVYVKGTGASAYVTDGTGRRGRITTLSDPSLTTTAACQAAGAALIQQYRSQLRGSFTISDSALNGSDGSLPLRALSITYAPLGLSAARYLVGQADSTFHGDKVGLYANTKVHFGGAAPSVVGLMRRLTRDTLS